MAVVVDFPSQRFDAGDFAVLRDIFSRFRYPAGWCGWSPEIGADGSCLAIEIVDPNEWEHFRLSRTRTGQYCAADTDDRLVSAAPALRELLENLDIFADESESEAGLCASQ